MDTLQPKTLFIGENPIRTRWVRAEGERYIASCNTADDGGSISLYYLPEVGMLEEGTESQDILLQHRHQLKSKPQDFQLFSQDRGIVAGDDGIIQHLQFSGSNQVSVLSEFQLDFTSPVTSVAVTASSTGAVACSSTSSDFALLQQTQDGSLHSSQGPAPSPSRTITSMAWSSLDLLATGCSSGAIEILDLRRRDGPSVACQHDSRRSAPATVSSLIWHPARPDVLVSGTSEGLLAIWDMRHASVPISVFPGGHVSHVLDCCFHPIYANHIFTCGQDGLVLHWQTKSGDFLDRYIPSQDQGGDVEVLDLLGGGNDSAINSLHVDGSDLVFGTDNEAIVVVSNVIDY